MFLVFPFSKIHLFTKDLIGFTISFVSLFVSVSLEHLNNEEGFTLVLLPLRLYPASKRGFRTFSLLALL